MAVFLSTHAAQRDRLSELVVQSRMCHEAIAIIPGHHAPSDLSQKIEAAEKVDADVLKQAFVCVTAGAFSKIKELSTDVQRNFDAVEAILAEHFKTGPRKLGKRNEALDILTSQLFGYKRVYELIGSIVKNLNAIGPDVRFSFVQAVGLAASCSRLAETLIGRLWDTFPIFNEPSRDAPPSADGEAEEYNDERTSECEYYLYHGHSKASA
jgi:hypothetical protein